MEKGYFSRGHPTHCVGTRPARGVPRDPRSSYKVTTQLGRKLREKEFFRGHPCYPPHEGFPVTPG